jgi:hypothetical protein
MRESVHRTECELAELVTEIGTISSTWATVREMLSWRADDADQRLSRIDKSDTE